MVTKIRNKNLSKDVLKYEENLRFETQIGKPGPDGNEKPVNEKLNS